MTFKLSCVAGFRSRLGVDVGKVTGLLMHLIPTQESCVRGMEVRRTVGQAFAQARGLHQYLMGTQPSLPMMGM
ncbi:hypothetical protein D3C76_1572120 [compost metagenome]